MKWFRSISDTAEYIKWLVRRIDTLTAALQWYLDDDYRSVEAGILERVEDRPAYKVIHYLDSKPEAPDEPNP